MSSPIRKFQNVAKKHRVRVGRFLAGLGFPEYTILTIFSVIIGVTAGFAGVGLHELIEVIQNLCFRGDNGAALGWVVILVPVIGMLVQSAMTHAAPRQASQKGVLEIIKSVGLHCGYLSFRSTLFHFLAPAICIGTGGTVGPEAPAAQSGAGAASIIGRMMGLSHTRQSVFTAAGAGAAIAAIFNTPLAGVFFAIEVVLLHDFRASALSAFLLAAVSASTVSRLILGNEPLFAIASVHIGPVKHYVGYLIMGIGAGLLSMAFIRSNELFKRSCRTVLSKAPKPLGMATVGVLMGLAGYWQPGVFGIGYESMNQVLGNTMPDLTVMLLLILKFILVVLIIGVGGFGGVFAPSLFMGACFGHLFAVAGTNLLGIPLDPTTYSLVGMGAILAGINSVPLTAIMIIFETTNDYHFILPLMLGVVGSTLVVQMTLKGSIYARELEQHGYHYSMGRETRILESMTVESVMRKKVLTVPEETPLTQLVQRCLENPHQTIYTTDDRGRINGVILSSSLHEIITEYQDLKTMVVAKDLAETQVPFLTGEQTLDSAMSMFVRYRVEEIPVVRQNGNEQTVGILHYQDILNTYNNAKVKLNLADSLSDDLSTISVNEVHDVLPGMSVIELSIPSNFTHKTLQELRLRNRFDIDVLMIEKDAGPFSSSKAEVERIVPQTNYEFASGDRIVIFGLRDKVEAFARYVKNNE